MNIVVWREDEENGAAADPEYLSMGDAINISCKGVHYDAVAPSITCSDTLSKEDPAIDTTRESEAEALTEKTTIKSLGKLKTIFWNSNGWEQERCEKIAEVALEEEADVICILEARMHPAREGHMKG